MITKIISCLWLRIKSWKETAGTRRGIPLSPWQFLLSTEELLLSVPQLPAVSFYHSWCSKKKSALQVSAEAASSEVLSLCFAFFPSYLEEHTTLSNTEEFHWLWQFEAFIQWFCSLLIQNTYYTGVSIPWVVFLLALCNYCRGIYCSIWWILFVLVYPKWILRSSKTGYPPFLYPQPRAQCLHTADQVIVESNARDLHSYRLHQLISPSEISAFSVGNKKSTVLQCLSLNNWSRTRSWKMISYNAGI